MVDIFYWVFREVCSDYAIILALTLVFLRQILKENSTMYTTLKTKEFHERRKQQQYYSVFDLLRDYLKILCGLLSQN